MKTIQLHLYPNRTQSKLLETNLECCRTVYNRTLEYCKTEWDSYRKSHTFFDLTGHLTEMKKDDPDLYEGHSQCEIDAVKRVRLAFSAFFAGAKKDNAVGYPRFKGKNRYRSFTYTHKSQFSIVSDRKLRLSKIGDVKYRGQFDKGLLENSVPKTCTLKKGVKGWDAYITIETDGTYVKATETFGPKKAVGIDLNIRNLATFSDGTTIPNDRHLEMELDAISKDQRKLSKCERDSPGYRKIRERIARRHRKVANLRKDRMHKTSRFIADNYSFVAFEDIDEQKLIDAAEWPAVRRSFYSAAWRQLVTFTRYKVLDAGSGFAKVDPRYTTQMCSGCGNIVPKTIGERTHRCDVCGLEIDRDLNAARNILERAGGAGLCHSIGCGIKPKDSIPGT